MILYNNKLNIEVKNADSFIKKTIGLMFKKNFTYGLKFRCNGIHTFFMREKIDVILTDKNNKILYIYPSLQKNKILLPKRNVYYTYEFPDNSVSILKVGEILKLKSD